MIGVQLDFFKSAPSDFDLLSARIDSVDTICANVRRGVFSRINKMEKKRLESEDRISYLERELEKLKKTLGLSKKIDFIEGNNDVLYIKKKEA